LRARRTISIVGISVVACVAFVALVVLPWLLASADSPAIERTPADRGLAFRDVELHPSDQPITIRGWWIPASQPVAAVLFVHGGNANREDSYFGALDYYKSLHDRNISVLAIDLRNHGASDKSASGHLTFGKEEQLDAKAGLDWIRAEHPELRIFGSADSMGGATLLHLAAAGGRFDGLILIDPVLDNEHAITGAIAATLGLPRALIIPTAWSALHVVNTETLPANPMDAASDLALPILLIQDETDPVTQVQFARELARRNKHVELHVIGLADDDAVPLSTGGWGAHVSAFRRQPKRVMEIVDRFLASR
jgi:pimeloyl-ACP methyl ester carboxylesterase